MASSRRLNLSGVQVFAGVLATITGAVAASYLGVGGTLVGAAIGSLASTVGGEIYRHYLERTHERLRGVVDVHRYRTARSAVVGAVDPAVAQNRLGVTSRREDEASATAETQVLPVRPPGGPGPGTGTSPRPTSPNDPRRDPATETFGATASRSPAASAKTAPAAGAVAGAVAGAAAAGATAASTAAGVTADITGADSMGATEAAGGGPGKRPRWVILTAITVGTFLVAVVVITVIELSVGKTLHAIVTNRPGTGTTVGGVVGGQKTSTTKATPAATPTPTTVPAGSSSATAPVSATPPATSSGATPTPSASITPGAPNDPLPTPTPAS
jgi:hypothetical protein